MRIAAFLALWVYAALKVLEISSVNDILKEKHTLIYFYAPDCKYCAAFEPQFEYLAKVYEGNEDFQTVKINCRKHRLLAETLEVQAFPTFKIYDRENKQMAVFTNKRTLENLDDFIATYSPARANPENLDITVKTLETARELNEFLQSGRPLALVIATSSSAEWSTFYYPTHFFHRMSKEDPNTTYAIVFADKSDGEILRRYHVSNFPSMLYFGRHGVRALNTWSTNVMQNYKLEEEEARLFVRTCSEARDRDGWFASAGELGEYAGSLEYEGHRHFKGGFNVVEGGSGGDVDADYNQLVADIAM